MRTVAALAVTAIALAAGAWVIHELSAGGCADCGGGFVTGPSVGLRPQDERTLLVTSATPGLRYADVAFEGGARAEPHSGPGWSVEREGRPVPPDAEILAGDLVHVPPHGSDAPLRVLHLARGVVVASVAYGESR